MKNYGVDLWALVAILNFGGIFEDSLAHPHMVENVIFKFQNICPLLKFLRPQEKCDAGYLTLEGIQKWLKSPFPYSWLKGNIRICINFYQVYLRPRKNRIY